MSTVTCLQNLSKAHIYIYIHTEPKLGSAHLLTILRTLADLGSSPQTLVSLAPAANWRPALASSASSMAGFEPRLSKYCFIFPNQAPSQDFARTALKGVRTEQ